ncbi:hypothetical protein M569_13427 [Genlisea aurea]|uniref:DNA helicase n=1 Tax=Genlisea aurea TaxID=192259 RepID=S8C3J4_9LAMI|nr:hypothetical protein M569_13427 [Genlisea aurea]
MVENGSLLVKPGRRSAKSNGVLPAAEKHNSNIENHKITKLIENEMNQVLHECTEEQDDDDFEPSGEEKEGLDDETTLLEEEQLAKEENLNNFEDEISLLQNENEIPLEELLAKYRKGCDGKADDCSESLHSSTSDEAPHSVELERPFKQPGDDDAGTGKFGQESQSDSTIADAAAAARSAQPTGNTFSTTKVRTKFPFLLKYPLREYQHIGLDWLVTMYEKRLNGILADEMGLGKTIMTISLLAHLACEKGIWGPHLIVVPTSVMLNWETEFLKWCPAFKILTYFGSAKERKNKRQGWMKPNSFHICVTTYRLVIQDAKVFKRKKWKYLILDEAHLIKNWKSQRWQTLLNFNSKRRILLTGTPLQNDLMELWSLMHFLMPHVFQSHQEFKDWFSNPISGMVEGQEKVNKEVVDRLHNVLRPFILRRLKRDVEKQLPVKHEHVIYCRLSRRQRSLYEDFIASSETQATLASANFFGMISVIMQLRKVCNHPDLFEGRPIVSSFDMKGIDLQLSSSVCSILKPGPFSTIDLSGLGLVFTHLDFTMSSWEHDEIQAIATPAVLIKQRGRTAGMEGSSKKKAPRNIFEEIRKALSDERLKEAEERAAAVSWWNSLRCNKKPLYATDLQELVSVGSPAHAIHLQKQKPVSYDYSSKLADVVLSPVERVGKMVDEIESFMFAIPAARAPPPVCWCSRGGSPVFTSQMNKDRWSQSFSDLLTPFRPAIVRRQVYFPDRRLIQFDCGKLQELAVLLRRLKSEGHRALIFTQMTKMLDVLESFINLYGYTYMRLDGSTPPEERQTLMQRFNTNPKIFLFILSTRSGGVGINLVGADTVIFYDSDWNPAMDQQAQDRCHRIGQTREVHIYRLISESTIEENILKKANQKRALDDLVIQSGDYNTEFFKKLDPMEFFSDKAVLRKGMASDGNLENYGNMTLSSADLDAALKNAEDEADYMALKKVEEEEAVDNQEFTEDAVARMDDDELLNEDEMNHGTHAENSSVIVRSDVGNVAVAGDTIEEENFAAHADEDDIDMLADVKEMAAAAAASGEAVFSFENQLRPIDRYAIGFLETWDPLIHKAAVESHTEIEETEWELERIEQLKDEMEAEIDEDEEPLVYESWDADFATEVYKQQVEILAQNQLKEDQEREAREKEAMELANSYSLRNDTFVTPKPKSKKKTRKPKFKSLKKGALASKSTYMRDSSVDPLHVDDELIYDDMMASSDTFSPSSTHEKRHGPASDDDEHKSANRSKRLKTASEQKKMVLYSKPCSRNQDELFDDDTVDLGSKYSNRINKVRAKLSISMVPPRRVFTIKPEKVKRKGNFYSRDFFSPDLWSPTEDALLCALVHEYGLNWSLASDIMYGLTAGGSYRGRFHHHVHCCERFRDLMQRYVLSLADGTNDKTMGGSSSAKTLLRITEDNIRVLLSIASRFQDPEPLLQKHFFAVLSASLRDLRRQTCRKSNMVSAKNGYYAAEMLPSCSSEVFEEKIPGRLEFTNLYQCGKIVSAALNTSNETSPRAGNRSSILSQSEGTFVRRERLDLILELPREGKDDLLLPSSVNVSVLGPDPPSSSKIVSTDKNQLRSSYVANAVNDDSVSPTGKHKQQQQVPVSESAKSCKSKSRKMSKVHADHHRTGEGFLPNMPCESSSAAAAIYYSESGIDDGGEISFWASPGSLPFIFGPDLMTSEPDDPPDFTGIG